MRTQVRARGGRRRVLGANIDTASGRTARTRPRSKCSKAVIITILSDLTRADALRVWPTNGLAEADGGVDAACDARAARQVSAAAALVAALGAAVLRARIPDAP